MMQQNNSETQVEDLMRQRDVRFFQPTLLPERIPHAFSNLLQEYSKIPQAEQVSHILRVRDQAYTQRPYPCLGRFRFLDLDLAAHPLYHTYVLPRLLGAAPPNSTSTTTKSDTSLHQYPYPTFLDVGTCLGQDLRKLLHDGVSVQHLYGADIDPSFQDISYALFKDEDKFPRHHFLTGPGCDLLAGRVENDNNGSVGPEPGLHQLDGKIDILNVTAVFHLFDLEEQKTIARRCLRLLRSRESAGTDSNGEPESRCLVLGGQAGNLCAGHTERMSSRKFRHNVESWREMWEDVAAEDEWKQRGITVDVWSELHERSWGDGKLLEGSGEGDGKQEWNSKIVGAAADGHRWHVFSVWVEFGNEQSSN